MSNGNMQRKPKIEDSSRSLRGKKHLTALARIKIAHKVMGCNKTYFSPRDCGMNLQLCTCKAEALPLRPPVHFPQVNLEMGY
jgi:hypothetical protein